MLTDWGKEHHTQKKQFQKTHAGLTRAQIYRLVSKRYGELAPSDEILQSTGIFLCIMAALTAMLPFFDLKFIDFATAGSIPAILCIVTAIIGILMIVIAQRKNPVTALGLGIGLLLMFVVAYVAVYDYFGDENPFRNNVASNDAQSEPQDDEKDREQGDVFIGRATSTEPPIPAENFGGHQIGPAPVRAGDRQKMLGDHARSRAEASRRNGNKDNDGNALASSSDSNVPDWLRDDTPLSPDDITIPDDYDPDDDNLYFDNSLDPVEPEPEPPTDPEAAKRDRYLRDQEQRKPRLLDRIIANMKSEMFRNGKPSTYEFENNYEVAATAGRVSEMGIAYLLDKPLTGFDFYARGGVLIKKLVPANGDVRFASSISSGNGDLLTGIICHFGSDAKKELRGLQPKFMKNNPSRDVYLGEWAGQPLSLGSAGREIDSDGRPVYGFLIYTEKENTERSERIVGVGLVIARQ